MSERRFTTLHGLLAVVLLAAAVFTASFAKMTKDVGGNFAQVVVTKDTRVLGAEAEALQPVLLVINTGTQTLLNSAVPIGVNDTVLSVVTRATAENGLTLKTQQYDFGTIVYQIGNSVGGTDGKYWLYAVNGTDANVGADQFKLEGGEVVTFRFAAN